MVSVKCPKCLAPVEIDAGTKFTKCPFCSTQIYIDRSGAGFYYIIDFTLDEEAAIGTFKRWASGPSKVKNLDRDASITSLKKMFFPTYFFRRHVAGKEKIIIEPAQSTTLPGLHSLKIPAGDFKIFDNSFDLHGAELLEPDIEMLHYLDGLPGEGKEQALVYFPIWNIEYSYKGKNYRVIIDASSSEVFSSSFPARSSASYLAVTVGGFIAFFLEGALAVNHTLIAAALMGATAMAVFLIAYKITKEA